MSVRDALDQIVNDAVASQGAEARMLDRDPAVSWERTAALARLVAAHVAEEARKEGPPQPEELSTLLVVHAVVLRRPTLREDDAVALARSVREAVLGAPTADEFIARAQSVPHARGPLVAQSVGPFAADGRDPSGGELDPEFVATAFALRTPGETSPIVTTPFGWHVLQLVERRTPRVPPEESGSTALPTETVQRLRAHMRLDAMVRRRRTALQVDVAVDADELMGRIAGAQP